jgi:hypothetical protein
MEHNHRLGSRARPYADGDDYGFANRDDASLHQTFQPTSYYHTGAIVTVCLTVNDANALYAEWSRPGIGGETTSPADMPWGMYEGTHTDPTKT